MNDQHVRSNDMLRRVRSRYWMGTIWCLIDKDYIKQLDTEYCLISDDDHTEDRQLHWHCLIKFSNPRVYPATTTTHWEKVVDVVKARDYCLNKGPNFYEEGNLNIRCQNGEEWKSFVELCKTATPKELIESPFSQLYARYRGFASEVHNKFAEVQILDGQLEHIWLTGEPGTGKTSYVFNNFNNDLYVKAINKWWDGYHGQDNVLLDDWDPKHDCLVGYLKTWADRFPFRAEAKGSTMFIRPKKIIITSNYSIENCFQNPEDVAAIRRRFKVIRFWKVGNICHNSEEIQ